MQGRREKRTLISNDYTKLEDMVLKTAAQFFGDELFCFFKIKGRPLRPAPTEQIHLEAQRMYEDFNYEITSRLWYHFEFESDSICTADFLRFREYEAVTSRTYGVDVVTYVICSSNVKQIKTKIKLGINTYRIKVIRLKDNSADNIFQNFLAKDAAKIQKRDLFPILLTPLMSGKMPLKERFLQGFDILRKHYVQIDNEDLKRR